jgi:ABC-type antimicrobial peptide transport system permease subunit
LAVIISCLGLFGLAAFIAEQRTKEVGIRKVMGASVASLVMLISRDFSRLVIFAFVISAPLAWWIINDFLDRYAYRVSIPLWIYPVTGIGALLLAIAIVGTQAFRAARTNPVNSLRNE